MGARLSGGGFGGSAVVMVHPRDVENVSRVLARAYRSKFSHSCDIRVIKVSSGAQRI
jgi:galactokinase